MGGTGVLHPTEISGRPKEVTTKILDQNLARTVNTAFLTIHYPPSQTFFFCFSNLPKVSLSHGTTFSQHLPAPQGAENNLFNHQSYFQQSPNNQTCRSSTLLEKCSKPDHSEASLTTFSASVSDRPMPQPLCRAEQCMYCDLVSLKRRIS